MIVVILAALVIGLLTLAVTWSKLGLIALVLASAIASAAGLLTGLFLAFSRKSGLASKERRIYEVDSTNRRNNLKKLSSQPSAKLYYFDIEKVEKVFSDESGAKSQSLELALDDAGVKISEIVDELSSRNPGATFVLAVRDEGGSSITRLPVERILSQTQRHKRSA